MSQDEEQNRRIGDLEKDASSFKAEVRRDMGELKANQQLMAQSFSGLKEQFGTGMTDLKDQLQRARKAEAEERAALRVAEKEEAERAATAAEGVAARRERMLVRFFGLIGSLITLAGGVGATGAYYGMQAEPAPAEAAPQP